MSSSTTNKVLAVGGIILGIIYLLNPTAGLIEFIPDALPVIGNLDEAGATALILWGIQSMRQPANPPALPDRGKQIQ